MPQNFSGTDKKQAGIQLGRNNLYIGFLEAKVQASNKEWVYGLVHPNPGSPRDDF